MPSRQAIFLRTGAVLCVAVTVLGSFLAVWTIVRGASGTNLLTVGDTAPQITNVVVNNGNPITLVANATQTVSVTFTLTDGSGCGTVFGNGNVTTTLYREGVSTTCGVADPGATVLNTLNCYVVATTTNNCTSGSTTSAIATSTFEVWYFGQATDASSSFPNNPGWMASVFARDSSGNTSSGVSAAVELNTLLAIDALTSTLGYGTIPAGQNTSGTNQISTIKNAGNSSTTLNLSGNALVSGANSIATSAQHYATGTFTYGGAEQALSSTAVAVSGFLIQRPPATAAWSSATALPNILDFPGATIYNRYAYVAGGCPNSGCSSLTSTVLFAPVGASGTVGTWSNATALPAESMDTPLVAYNGYLYAVGGCTAFAASDCTAATSTVWFAPVNSTGSIGSWSSTTAMPNVLYGHQSVIVNGYLYVIAGCPSNVCSAAGTSSVKFAPINATGSLGSWSSTAAISLGVIYPAASAADGTIFVSGGCNSLLTNMTCNDGANVWSTVWYARPNATGSISSWTTAQSLPETKWHHGSFAENGIVYFLGGCPNEDCSNGATTTVYFAPSRGSDGRPYPSWGMTASLPAAISGFGSTAADGYGYVFGGNSAGTATNAVRFLSLASRNTYWGVSVSSSQATGNYSSTVTYTAVFSQ